ncbi:STAS domain-containing protein [Streptacidiphilus monticola]
MERAQPGPGATTQQGRAGGPRGPAPGRPPESPTGLSVTVRTQPGGVVVALDGELDHGTVGQLSPVLEGIRVLGADRVILDCARLNFFDSSGLRVLLRGRRLAEAEGGSLELAAPSRCWS